jgi:hypothetical protein
VFAATSNLPRAGALDPGIGVSLPRERSSGAPCAGAGRTTQRHGSLALVGALTVEPLGLAAAALARYHVLLVAAPLATKVATAAVLSTGGDLVAQRLAFDSAQRALPAALRRRYAPADWDARRTLMFAVFGAVYTGAIQHAWFGLLHSAEVARLLPCVGGGTLSRTIARVLLNQLGMIPSLYFALFYAWRGVCRRETPAQTLALARGEWWPTLRLNWAFWLPAQTVLFATLPVAQQAPSHPIPPPAALSTAASSLQL